MTEQHDIETNKLFVGNLHWHVRWQELKEYFSQWGEVEYASVALDRETKKSRGFGFVTFTQADDAERAKVEANEKELNGRVIYVDFARARDEAPADGSDDMATADPAGEVADDLDDASEAPVE